MEFQRMMSCRYIANGGFVLMFVFLVFSFVTRIEYHHSNNEADKETSTQTPDEISIQIQALMKAPVTFQQDDHKLIQYIRDKYLVSPSTEDYNLKGESDNPSMGQAKKIMELFDNKHDGFFVECGALDGETRSNSLVFEKKFGWQGILIEGDPKNFKMVLAKNRKAWGVGACLSTLPYPNLVAFQQQFNIGKISNLSPGSIRHGLIDVQCFPIYSILLAVGRTNVDYFSLDVEGNEFDVLKTIPWSKVNITTLSVEYIHGKERKTVMQKYMESQGYLVYAEVNHPGNLANDFIFYHPKLLGRIVEKR